MITGRCPAVTAGRILERDLAILPCPLRDSDERQHAGALDRVVQTAASCEGHRRAAGLTDSPRGHAAGARIQSWDFSTPTGLTEGFDPGDNPNALAAPSPAQIDASVAASLFAIWRSHAIRNTVDATLTKVGLGSALPGGSDGYAGLKFLLDNFSVDERRKSVDVVRRHDHGLRLQSGGGLRLDV